MLAVQPGWSNATLDMAFGGMAQQRKTELTVLHAQAGEARDVQARPALAQAMARHDDGVPTAEAMPGTG